MNPADEWRSKVDRATNDPDRIEKRTRPSAGMCPDNCACQQEDAMTTPLDLEDIG